MVSRIVNILALIIYWLSFAYLAGWSSDHNFSSGVDAMLISGTIMAYFIGLGFTIWVIWIVIQKWLND